LPVIELRGGEVRAGPHKHKARPRKKALPEKESEKRETVQFSAKNFCAVRDQFNESFVSLR